MYLPLKTPGEIEALRDAGRVNHAAHRVAESLLRPGVTPSAIDAAVERFFDESGAEPLFRGVPGHQNAPYPAVSCISVNDGVVHGIPSSHPLREGDLVSIDLGCRVDGWCADSAESHIVGRGDQVARYLARTTRQALEVAIRELPAARCWSDVVRRVDVFVRRAGLTGIDLVMGHGIGRELHEPPQVSLNLNSPVAPFVDFDLVPGLVFTIEPVLTTGFGLLRVADDGWTLATTDGHRAAHWEHTVALTEAGVRILTAGEPSLP